MRVRSRPSCGARPSARLDPISREQELRDYLGGFDFRGDMATTACGPFSGGEKSRLALALLIWQRPHLLLLAEPTNQLDVRHPLELMELASRTSQTVVVALHDLAVLRAINNLTIIVPADNFETREAIRAAAQSEQPVYLRFGKAAMYGLHKPETRYEVGKAITLRDGADVAFIGTGETVALHYSEAPSGDLRFEIRADARGVASGVVALALGA